MRETNKHAGEGMTFDSCCNISDKKKNAILHATLNTCLKHVFHASLNKNGLLSVNNCSIKDCFCLHHLIFDYFPHVLFFTS